MQESVSTEAVASVSTNKNIALTEMRLISAHLPDPIDGELGAKGTAAQQAVTTTSKILLNGAEVSFSVYNIGGNSYFKLRDLGEVFNL